MFSGFVVDVKLHDAVAVLETGVEVTV